MFCIHGQPLFQRAGATRSSPRRAVREKAGRQTDNLPRLQSNQGWYRLERLAACSIPFFVSLPTLAAQSSCPHAAAGCHELSQNAHILFKLKNGLGNERNLFHFVEELMREIPDYVRRPPVPVPQGRPVLPGNSQSRWWWSLQTARRTTGTHIPDLVTRTRDQNARQAEVRKRCKYCIHVRTLLYCSNCQVFLCGGACWHAWHSLRELPPAEEMRRVAHEPEDDDLRGGTPFPLFLFVE